MPDEAVHAEQAAHNERFLGRIDRNQHGDWAATVLFYAALHLVDAYLAKAERQHPGDHEQRSRLIRANARTRRIWNQYRRLQERSRDARYNGTKFTARDIEDLCIRDFAPLKMECTKP